MIAALRLYLHLGTNAQAICGRQLPILYVILEAGQPTFDIQSGTDSDISPLPCKTSINSVDTTLASQLSFHDRVQMKGGPGDSRDGDRVNIKNRAKNQHEGLAGVDHRPYRHRVF
jgi:hypothetical protein